MSAVPGSRTPPRPVAAGARLCARARAVYAGQADRRARPRVRSRGARNRQASRPTKTRAVRAPRCARAIAAATDDLCRYPDGNGFALKAALSARNMASRPTRIVLGNGSNDVLELVTQAFLRPGRSRGLLAPRVRRLPARRQGARRHRHRGCRRAITRTICRRCARRSRRTRAWCSSPIRTIRPERGSRPTRCEAFIASIPEDVVIVLDEAYNEYLDPAQNAPSAAWTGTHANLIVSRTFSKAYGLAALRVGYGIMNANVADMLNRVRQPFNVNALAQAAALAALADTGYVDESRALNRTRHARARGRRARARPRLRARRTATSCWSTSAMHATVYRAAAEAGRDRAPGRQLRTARSFSASPIGLPAENRRFLDALCDRARALSASAASTVTAEAAPHRQARRHRRRARRRLVRAGAQGGGTRRQGRRRRSRPRQPRARRGRAGSSTARVADRRRLDARAAPMPTSCCWRRRSRSFPRCSPASTGALPAHAILTDAGSTKQNVIADARRAPRRHAAAVRSGPSDRRHRAHRRGGGASRRSFASAMSC